MHRTTSSGTSNVVRFHPQNNPRLVTLLGSTGTIGQNALSLIEAQPHAFRIFALTACQNADLLIRQALKFQPQNVVIEDQTHYARVRDALQHTTINVLSGKQALEDVAGAEVDMVMSGIVGAAALAPTLAAIRAGNIIGLANKECLVCAGDYLMDEVQEHNAFLIPVDSEHNAIYQALDYEHDDAIEMITLTASGGPFRTFSSEQMRHVTPQQAVAHPNWSMGAKISVDSATMMNKGLELIEAYHLFGVETDQLDIVVHPESIIHGLVTYTDGSMVAGLSTPDMRVPLAYALGWPERMQTGTQRLKLSEIGRLTFEAPDEIRFPALRLARHALKAGGSAPCVLNAANEVAVEAFLKGVIPFLAIARVVEETLHKIMTREIGSIEDVMAMDITARKVALHLVERKFAHALCVLN